MKRGYGDYDVLPCPPYAGMAKLVDALDLGSSGATHRSSTLLTRTNFLFVLNAQLLSRVFFWSFSYKRKNTVKRRCKYWRD